MGSAPAVHVTEATGLREGLEVLGLRPPRPTVVVVGGAAGLQENRWAGLRPVFAEGIASVVQKFGAVGIDGGTRFGVMRLFGEARASSRVPFPLVGVVAAGSVKLRRAEPISQVDTTLDANHSGFVFVPGQEWGAEVPWIARAATVLAAASQSVTVLINGGQIAYRDVQQSVEAGRRVLAVSGSGGTADVFAAAVTGAPAEERVLTLIRSGMIDSVPMDDPALLAGLLTAALGGSTAT